MTKTIEKIRDLGYGWTGTLYSRWHNASAG